MAAADLEANKSLIRAFVAAINAHQWAQLATLVTADFVRHSAAGGEPGVRSLADLERFLRGELLTFPDARETIEDLIAEGDRVAARHHFRGTQLGPLGAYPASGRVLAADYLAFYRISGGRIAEAWAEWDTLSGLVQLGHVVR